MPYATHSWETPVKPFIPIFFLLLKIQINPVSQAKGFPLQGGILQGGISRPLLLGCEAWRCLLAKMRVCFVPQPNADAQPPRTTELCKKGLELDGDWVVLFCSSANWVSGTGRTGPSRLQIVAPGRGTLQAAQGARDQFTFPPQPCFGCRWPPPGPARPGHTAAACPRAPQSPNLLPALDSTGEAQAKDKGPEWQLPKEPVDLLGPCRGP